MNPNNHNPALMTKPVIAAWLLSNRRFYNLIGKFTEEEIYTEIAPGKNTGIYILGHLTSISDSMLPLLNFEEKLFPQLDPLFVAAPDKSGQKFPLFHDLKEYWNTVNTTLLHHIEQMASEAWLEKHEAVSLEDFKKDPSRNKLSILISRTNHQNYHLGQLTLLL